MIKKRVARERERGGNPARYYRRKYQNAIKEKVPLTFDIHHLNGNWQDIEITNLVALPKKLHVQLHRFGNRIVYIHNRFYIPYSTVRPHDWEQLKKVVDEVKQWIEYRDYRIGKVALNLTGLNYN